jgi:hypothetical protein
MEKLTPEDLDKYDQLKQAVDNAKTTEEKELAEKELFNFNLAHALKQK